MADLNVSIGAVPTTVQNGPGAVNLTGSGSGVFFGSSEGGSFTGWNNFSTLNVGTGGTWTLDGAGHYSQVNVATGATLIVGAPQGSTNGTPTGAGLFNQTGSVTIVNNGVINFADTESSIFYNPAAPETINLTGTGSLQFTGAGTTYLRPSSTIQSGGGMTVAAGKLVLLGTITAVATINAGATLQLGDGGAVISPDIDPGATSGTYTDTGLTGTLIGDIIDNGTLVYDRLDSAVAPGSLTGHGILQKLAPSALTLQASSHFTGRVLADGGILNLAGVIDTSEASKAAISSSQTTGSTVTISNTGTVQSATGAAIDMTGAQYAVVINNFGTLSGDTSPSVAAAARVAVQLNAFNDTFTNSGTVNGKVVFGAATQGVANVNTFTNTGTVNGDVVFTGAVNTLDSHAGTITGTVTLGAGANTVSLGSEGDTVLITQSGTDTITLGSGSDNVTLAAANVDLTGSPIVINHFQAGTGGDKLNISAYLNAYLQGYTPGSNPFAGGFLRLFNPGGSDTQVQVDQNGGGDNYQTLLTLKGTSPYILTAANFDGIVPVASPTITSVISTSSGNQPAFGGGVGGLGGPLFVGTAGNDIINGGAGNDTLRGLGGTNFIDGGAGVNSALFDSPLRAYTITTNGATETVTGGPYGETTILTNIQRLQFTDGYLAVGPTDTAGQIYRLYEATLGRAPDPVGLANWVHALNGGQSLQSVVGGFTGSQEFLNTYGPALSNNDFVTLLYNNVLHRAPDAGGLANWVGLLANGTDTRAQVVLGFSESPEEINNVTPTVQAGLWVQDVGAAQVARLYDTAFGRLPDPGGLSKWVHDMDFGTSTLLQVAAGVTGSPEFQNVYGALNDSQFVNQLYLNTLHRPGDPGGVTNWVNFLAAGHTRAEVVVGFSESQEHINNDAPFIDHGVWFV